MVLMLLTMMGVLLVVVVLKWLIQVHSNAKAVVSCTIYHAMLTLAVALGVHAAIGIVGG
jgi:hypothetical protein